MSAETKQALEDAIAAHFADEYSNPMIGSWVAIAEIPSIENMDEGSGQFSSEASGSFFSTLGLVHLWLNATEKGE